MSRIQLALNVDDIDKAVDFYSTLFDTPPAKRRPGYANFAVADPPLKLVLFEAQADRLEAAGLALDAEGDVVCCYARQDKHWVTGPDGQRWENYVVLADDRPELEGKAVADLEPVGSGGCCSTGAGESACCTG
jgi:catechol 2,3-dioxygenase-like lactoylglutathione lyase family enzyme